MATSIMYVTLFTAALAETDYLSVENQSLLDKLFNGSARKLVAKLCQDEQLNEADIDELKKYFKVGADGADD